MASTERYGFESLGETLRHLIYIANLEDPKVKKLIFKVIRCLHCHVGARADQHAKVELEARIHTFHWEWLSKVQGSCNIKSIEKVVRVICDFYQSRVNQASFAGGGDRGVHRKKKWRFLVRTGRATTPFTRQRNKQWPAIRYWSKLHHWSKSRPR